NRPNNPMARGQPPEPKGDMTSLNEALGAKISGDAIVWDANNPHPLLIETPPEIVWVSRLDYRASKPGEALLPAFNDADPVAGGLQEVVVLFGGRVETVERKAAKDVPAAQPPAFTALLRSGPTSGQMPYSQLTVRTMFGPQLNPNRRPSRTGTQQTIAARLSGGEGNINAIIVGDLDMISETFFNIREQGNIELEFDNVTFVLNAVDSLAGDESLLELRKRRRAFRTLERVERQRAELMQTTLDTVANAERAAKTEQDQAQARFDARIKEIEDKKDLDENTKAIMIDSVRQAEQRKLAAQTTAIEDRKRQTIEDARLATRSDIEHTQLTIRLGAVALPPIPALAIGAIVFLRRRARETDVHTIPDPTTSGR
ncbi:MAG: Gldg family protein, partial [Phycisphaerales bacterium]